MCRIVQDGISDSYVSVEVCGTLDIRTTLPKFVLVLEFDFGMEEWITRIPEKYLKQI